MVVKIIIFVIETYLKISENTNAVSIEPLFIFLVAKNFFNIILANPKQP